MLLCVIIFPFHVMIMQGTLSNGNVVAVKQLFVKTTQGIDEFLNEVVLITGMKHRNLVNLKGCCLREHQRLLVYELVDNYDIEKVLLAGELQISFFMIYPIPNSGYMVLSHFRDCLLLW
jgi:hypothetical protein